MKSRGYASPLRAEQAEQTRERILEALAEQLAEAREEFSIPRVAARAGVSTRTVYHYFPNREAQVEALAAWIERQAGPDELPRRPDELAAYGAERYARFFAHERIMRAQLAPGVAEHVRARRRRQREKAIDECVAATRARPADVAPAAAMVKLLIGGVAGTQLLDAFGLSPEQATAVSRWVIELVVAALERGDGPTGRSPARR